MNPIRTNKPTFFGNDGDVLKSGQIFIGQPNQWPIDFPKTVTLQDSAGTQFTAQQPLTTNSQGQISYNGKAVIALVDGNYSMLVRDRNGVVVSDGYTPFVENTDSGGGGTTNATQVGTLLSDIKQFNVTPGDTVRNVGKTTALDDLGAYWLVVSNTGSPADDVDLIDFANGTQGQRINNELYASVVASDISDGTFDPAPIAADIKDGSFDPAVMSTDITSGAFKPEDADKVFTGNQSSVGQGDLSSGGQGFYLVETNSGAIGMVYYKTGIITKTIIEWRDTGTDTPVLERIQVNGAGSFFAHDLFIDLAGNSATPLSKNITGVWKV